MLDDIDFDSVMWIETAHDIDMEALAECVRAYQKYYECWQQWKKHRESIDHPSKCGIVKQ